MKRDDTMIQNDTSQYSMEIQRVRDLLTANRHKAALSFCVTTDSHLDDAMEDTLQHMKAVTKTIDMDFTVHLGDFLNGGFPRKHTARILKEQMQGYIDVSPKGVFYPVQGNHDGFVNYTTEGITYDIALDEDWYAATAFTEQYHNVIRPYGKPYYYADYPLQKIRLIFLASFSYTLEGETGTFRADPCNFQKWYRLSDCQLQWLKEEALNLGKEWTVLLFSHDGPLNLYDQTRLAKEPWPGNKKELFQMVLDARNKKGFSIAGWFIGHLHGDLVQIVEGIPFIIIGNQTSYVPVLWPMPQTGHFEPRERGTLSQDLWDAVLLNTDARRLSLYRFGAGVDRQIDY